MRWPSHPALLGSTVAVVVMTALASATVYSQERAQRGAEDPMNPCGIIYHPGAYGPFDYRTDRDKLKVVEDFHFTPQVEMLRAGQSGWIGGDLDYTLYAFPNHHRALAAMVKHTELKKTQKTEGMKFPVECYFDRAIRFSPDDTKVRSLYAQFLHKNNRTPEGLRQLDAAKGYAKDNAVAHYNIGLVYYQMGEHQKALAQAHKAQELGLNHPQLETLLKRSGHWKDRSQ
jgi:tetratricopeptide (TPR) repeat protein